MAKTTAVTVPLKRTRKIKQHSTFWLCLPYLWAVHVYGVVGRLDQEVYAVLGEERDGNVEQLGAHQEAERELNAATDFGVILKGTIVQRGSSADE
jgi:hypothetical protein